MKNKYNMTKEDNIFFAKRKLVDNIYKSANLEGIAVTFADTYSFMNNVNNGNISIDDMLKLKGLKDAWEYTLNNIDCELTIDYIKKIHFEICKGQNIEPLGEFRNKGVGITGTSWRPKLPNECNYGSPPASYNKRSCSPPPPGPRSPTGPPTARPQWSPAAPGR